MPRAEPSAATSQVLEPASFGCVLQYSGSEAAWIRLSGEVDLAAAPQVAARLSEALAGARPVVLDLRQVTFMDTSGLAVLVAAHNRARRSERKLVVVRGPRQVDRLLALTGLKGRLEITGLQPIPCSE